LCTKIRYKGEIKREMVQNRNATKILKPKIQGNLPEFDLLQRGISDYDSISSVLVYEIRFPPS